MIQVLAGEQDRLLAIRNSLFQEGARLRSEGHGEKINCRLGGMI